MTTNSHEEEAPAATAASRRPRNDEEFCVACGSANTTLKCSKCNFVSFCSDACKAAAVASHGCWCQRLTNPGTSSLERGILMFCQGKCYFPEKVFINGRYLYEQALDEIIDFLGILQRHHNNGGSGSGGGGGEDPTLVLGQRIVCLLAALGHDQLTVLEAHNCMLRLQQQQAPRVTTTTTSSKETDLTVSTDLIQLLGSTKPKDWPGALLFPLLLVKCRLVLQTTRRKAQFDAFMETTTGQHLLTAAPALKEMVLYEPTETYLSNQQQQLELLLDLLVTHEQTGEFFDELLRAAAANHHQDTTTTQEPPPFWDDEFSAYVEQFEKQFIKDTVAADSDVLALIAQQLERRPRHCGNKKND